ncbi:unnamed protein product [Ectocarpus sp. 6 AP-2014]
MPLVDTPQIVWHGGEAGKNAPILSLDTHPLALDGGHQSSRVVLATAGTDAEVRLWIVNRPTQEDAKNWEQAGVSSRLQTFVASLGGHQRGVNAVRFSPDGLSLASASDGGTVVIWSVEDVAAWSTLKSDRDTRKNILRGATEDIYDMAWSPDSKYITCGSIDRRAHVWEVATKRSIATLEDHANYVQGTAWDPQSKYMATQSSDRSCRVYQITQDGGGGSGSSGAGRVAVKCCNVIKSCVVPSDEGSSGGSSAGGEPPLPREGTTAPGERPSTVTLDTRGDVAGCIQPTSSAVDARGSTTNDNQRSGGGDKGPSGGNEDACATGGDSTKDKAKPVQRKNLFVDETVTSFFRRLSWSPDGAFLITPTAQHWDAATRQTQFCTHLFTRGQFAKPAICLLGLTKPSVAVRCNPRLFTLKGCGDNTRSEAVEEAMCDLPYRAVFAVVSLDAVVVYDTEHATPLMVANGLHLSALTDACWSSDGLALFVSSTDGYVSKIHFEPGELGDTLPCSDVPLQTRRLHPVIYDWQTEVTPTEEVAGRVLRPSPPPSGVVRVERPTQAGGETSTGKALGLAPAPSPLPVATKQKKKIVPTLVTPLPAADRAQPVASSTAVPPSPTTPSTERKKRRITPTLCVPGMNEDASGDDGLVSGTQSPLPASAKHVAVGNETPKKKRLAPTLVSAL